MTDQPLPGPADFVLSRLARVAPLSREDADVVRQLSWTQRGIAAGRWRATQAVEVAAKPGFVVAGGVIMSRHRADGAKQAVGLALPGDPIGLRTLFDRELLDDVATLPGTVIVETGAGELRRSLTRAPGIAAALCTLLLDELSVAEQWILCLGKLDAMQRICHLFCEMAARMSAVGDSAAAVLLPLTQDQIADLVGLTPVHVNRTLQLLVKTQCVTLGRGSVRIDNIDMLRIRGRFDKRYLGALGV